MYKDKSFPFSAAIPYDNVSSLSYESAQALAILFMDSSIIHSTVIIANLESMHAQVQSVS